MIEPRSRTGILPPGLLLAAAVVGCESPDIFIPLTDLGGPAGVLEGTLTYSGPPPCTKDGRIMGAAIVLGFDTRTLPPPDGLGTSATSIDVITGDELFGGIRDQLPATPDGALPCPNEGAAPVTVSGTWVLAPLSSGTYQVRGFYDLDGNFDQGFGIANLPTRGDVGGGAIENAIEVLSGAAPRYREITLGVPDANGVLEMPENGARVGGIAVTLGLTLPLERPIFHVEEVLTPSGSTGDTSSLVMPADWELNTFSPTLPVETEESFIRVRLAAGVADGEVSAASKSPFLLPVGGMTAPSITYSRQDVNGDGTIDADDHVPDSQQIPSLFPLSVFSKLLDDSKLVNQSAPAVIIQGLTIYNDLTSTALAPETLNEAQSSVLVALRPAALCLHPDDPGRGGVLVVSRQTDDLGNRIIADEAELEATLTKQFGRPITIAYGCLPQGRYALKLVYSTGQAWTVPNEAGVCDPTEVAAAGTCGKRARLASQEVVLTIGPPVEAEYCAGNPTPALCNP